MHGDVQPRLVPGGRPDDREGARCPRPRLRALGVLDCVAARAGGIEEAEQAAQVDLLPGRVEDVRGARRRDANPAGRRGAGEVTANEQYADLWEKVGSVEAGLLVMDEDIASNRRKYQILMAAWRHCQIEQMTEYRVGDPKTPVTLEDELSGLRLAESFSADKGRQCHPAPRWQSSQLWLQSRSYRERERPADFSLQGPWISIRHRPRNDAERWARGGSCNG